MADNNKIAVIGGDIRQVYMINDLINREYEVCYLGLNEDFINKKAVKENCITTALLHSSVVLCPIPFSKDEIRVTHMENSNECKIYDLMNNLTNNHILIGGNIPKKVKEYCKDKDITFYDLMDREDFCILNAVATAEGVIAEAIANSSINIHKSKSLVLGYGRCGRIIAEKLSAMCSYVTVSDRNLTAIAIASAMGYKVKSLDNIDYNLCTYNLIVNTIPSLVLTRESIKNLMPDVLIIDIASSPGGVDFDAAKEMDINARMCPGLPGKYSPKTSGGIIASTLKNIFFERGDYNEIG